MPQATQDRSLEPGARSLSLDRLPALRRFLLAGRNADGGWGYYPGKGSRLEPTCWALLALPEIEPSVLITWPARNGLLQERPGGDANFAFHALALLTLGGRGAEHTSGNATLVSTLESAKGIQLEQATFQRQNNQLQGWSWIAGTFSWVEPTAWALLALKKRAAAGQRIDAARLNEAQALLVDRCCDGGGWNYGNANMLGKELRPYVPTTSVALLALQQPRSQDASIVVEKSLRYLERAALSEQSAVALSLATLALDAHGRPSDAPRAALIERSGRTIDLGNLLGVAMAVRAMRTATRDDDALSLSAPGHSPQKAPAGLM
jgi:hypothetical protein